MLETNLLMFESNYSLGNGLNECLNRDRDREKIIDICQMY